MNENWKSCLHRLPLLFFGQRQGEEDGSYDLGHLQRGGQVRLLHQGPEGVAGEPERHLQLREGGASARVHELAEAEIGSLGSLGSHPGV